MVDKVRLEPLQVLSYTGGPIHFIDGDTLVFKAGSGLFFKHLGGQNEDNPFVWNGSRAVDCFAVNHKKTLLAYSSPTISPAITVLIFPQLAEKCNLRNGAQLGYGDIVFSRDGSRLAAVGHSKEPTIFIWDVESETKLAEIPLPSPAVSLSFNPCDKDHIAATGSGDIYFLRINKILESSTITPIKGVLDQLSSDEDTDGTKVYDTTNGRGPIAETFSHCWAQENTVYVSSGPYVLKLNGETGQCIEKTEVKDMNRTSSTAALNLTLSHLIITSMEGRVRWLNIKTGRIDRQATIDKDGLYRVAGVARSPMFDKIVVGTCQGKLYDMGIEINPALEGEETSANIAMDVLADYHGERVISITALCAKEECIITGGLDGYLKVWDLSNDRLESSKLFVQDMDVEPVIGLQSSTGSKRGTTSQVPSTITALGAMRRQRVIAVGTGGGNVSLFYVEEEPLNLICMHKGKYFHDPITTLAWGDQDLFLAMSSSADKVVYTLHCTTEEAKENFEVTGAWTTKDCSCISSVAWSGNYLLYLDLLGNLYGANPTASTWSSDEGIGEPLTALWQVKINMTDPMGIITMPSKSLMVMIGASSASLKVLKLPGAHGTPKNGPLTPTTLATSNEKPILCLTVCSNEKYLATGDADGSVQLYAMVDGKPIHLDSFSLHRGPVVTVHFSRDSTKIFSTGLDGEVFRTRIGGAETDKAVIPKSGFDKLKMQYKLMNINGFHESPSSKSWSDSVIADIERRKCMQHEAYKETMRQKIISLGERLGNMLQNNDAAPDIEKLGRDEFVVNIEAREAQLVKNKKAADSLRIEIEKANMGKKFISSRILQACWDATEVHVKEIRALAKDGPSVHNFGLGKTSSLEKKKLASVMKIRALELRDIRYSKLGLKAWAGLFNEVPLGISWLVNEGLLKPTLDVGDLLKRLSAKDKAMAQGGQAGGNKSHKPSMEEEDNDLDVVAAEDLEKLVLLLLYPPEAIRTPNQKRTQIVLTLEFIRQLKKKFNEYFDTLFRAKEDEMEKSDARNERVLQILNELGSNDIPVRPVWGPGEHPTKILEVSPSEMKSKLYETEAMRETRRKQEEEKRIREEEAKKDNIGERALQDMMFGTLDAKSDLLSAAQALEKPEWMELTSADEWSEEQKAEAEAFESRKKKLQEEALQKRKELELELKKIKTEIGDACKSFDDKLEELVDLRLFAQAIVCQQELVVLRLAASLCQREEAALENRRLEAKLRELNKQKEDINTRISEFKQHYEEHRQETERLQNEDRALERNFRKDLQEGSSTPIDQDSLKILLGLYKTRPRNFGLRASVASARGGSFQSHRGSTRTSSKLPVHSSRRKSTTEDLSKGTFRRRSSAGASKNSSSGGIDVGPMQEAMIEVVKRHKEKARESEKDPFFGVEDFADKNREASLLSQPEITPLSQEADCPDGFMVSESVWNRLQELRNGKIVKEYELRKANLKLSDLKKVYDSLFGEIEALEGQIASITERKFENAKGSAEKERNTEVMVRLKQGQVEIEQGPFVTDYSDAVLIPVVNVAKVNNDIIRLGTEKVKTLTKIKDFRKNINFIEWESRYLLQVARDLEEHYKDLQLTRVTRNLQKILKGNHVEREREKAARGEARLGIISKAHQEKIETLDEKANKVCKDIRDRKMENMKLVQQLNELTMRVEAREAIFRSRADGAGGLNPAAMAGAKMKRITVRRRLVELARSQTEEMDFLKQELDRLRERTFPKFSNATLSRLSGNPDEIF